MFRRVWAANAANSNNWETSAGIWITGLYCCVMNEPEKTAYNPGSWWNAVGAAFLILVIVLCIAWAMY